MNINASLFQLRTDRKTAAIHNEEFKMVSDKKTEQNQNNCNGLVCWCLTALSAQIGYIVPEANGKHIAT